MANTEAFWRVYTAEGNQIIETVWSPGPTARKVLATMGSPEQATELARIYQRDYDDIRNTFSPA